MNNEQFRRLVSTPTPASGSSRDACATPRTGSGGAKPALGSRMRSSIPLTPRRVQGAKSNGASALFAQQLRERDSQNDPQQRKFRSKAAPRGSKLAAGYTDRAQLRSIEGGLGEAKASEDDKAVRIKALEDMVRLGQMERADFEKVRDEIVGGDVRNVHLVKGLDMRLLAKARAGEDVFGKEAKEEEGKEEESGMADVDEEFAALESKDIKPLEREIREKHGMMAPPPVAGRKRTRDDILREMKEARARAAEEQRKASQPSLGAHFKKIAPKNIPGTSRVEIDHLGREVLIVVDADGNVKRKVKKTRSEANGAAATLPMPNKDIKPLGMEVPENLKTAPVVEESEDIFADAGSDYNPLGNMDNDTGSSDSGSDGETEDGREAGTTDESDDIRAFLSEAIEKPLDDKSLGPRNYFGTDTANPSNADSSTKALKDPTILATLKRASATRAAEASSERPTSVDAEADEARLTRIRARLVEQDRDADDIDMGFGSSRFDDQEDGDESYVKLARWKGKNAGDNDENQDGEWQVRGEGQRKKRKKKKGDKNDASTVIGVLERRKG